MSDIAKQVDAFFMEQSPVHNTMVRLSSTLSEMQIPFAIAGAMAANAYGHKRTTGDIDVLMHRADLQRFKELWLGRGWVDKFAGSKGFKDTVTNVPIDVLISGDFPGDGRPKPVAFPDPESVVEIGRDNIPYVSLSSLIELKLTSGMTTSHRPRDLDDVIQLIRANALPQNFDAQLHSYVRKKYREMWDAAQIEDEY